MATKNVTEFKPGEVLWAAGWGRTVAEVIVEGEAVTVTFTPPQDPDTWEYLTDAETGEVREQPPMVTSIHDQFEDE